MKTLLLLLSLLTVVFCETYLPEANNEFALNLYGSIADDLKGANMFFSPVSVSLALGMIRAGTAGQTQSQMDQVLVFDEAANSDEELYSAFRELISTLNRPGKNYTLNTANRIFGQKGYPFKQEYLSRTTDSFFSSAKEMDFIGNPEGSRTDINDWVAEKTMDKIQELLPPGKIGADTVMVLVNAIYFKAAWKLPFDADETKSMPFHAIDGSDINMDMMQIQKYFNYHDNPTLDCKILELPYVGDEVSMFILLPNDMQGLAALEEDLMDADLSDILTSGLTPQSVRVTLPKFTMTQEMNLKVLLYEMGMEDVFVPGQADLSGMSNVSNLVLSQVVHKAFIDVDEVGTEAAGATAGIVVLTSALNTPVFKADHPFMFIIWEKTTQSALFMGRLTSAPDQTPVLGDFAAQYSTDDGISLVPSIMVLLCSIFSLMI